MKNNTEFFIVDKKVLPEVFIKVAEAKSLLEKGRFKTIQEAVNHVGISRSAFYKYKDFIFELSQKDIGRTITFSVNLDNTPGLLSDVLNVIAYEDANVLTINQTIPINGIANVVITIETGNSALTKLEDNLCAIKGVQGFKIIARE